MFAPLGDRVLIAPEAAPTQTESGLHLAEHWKPEQTGTVVAVGRPVHPRREDAFALAQRLEDMATQGEMPRRAQYMRDSAQLLRDVTGRIPEVKVGDFVIFSWQTGQELWVNNGESRYLLMRESDILAVVETRNEVAV